MKRISVFLSAFFVTLAFAAAAKATRPNFVLFQVDDMPRSLLFSQYLTGSGEKRPLMPNLEKYLASQGTQFTDFAANSPTCAPSRASLLSGQYAHNTRVVNNGGFLGGALGWLNSPSLERNNIATRLQEEGYQTAHFGKWMNHYGSETEAFIPRGWDNWVTDATDKSTRDFYGYRQRWHIPRLGIDSTVGPIGTENYWSRASRDPASCRIYMAKPGICNYHTDLMTRMAGSEIAAADSPFYMQIDYHAPHGDHVAPAGPQVATRHEHLLEKVILPTRSPNFNERDMSDKAYATQERSGPLRPANIEGIETFFRHAAVSLKAVDEGIGYIVRQLDKRGLLENTYLIFISDNGLFYGNHRFLIGKSAMYEESSKVPYLMSGPGVPVGLKNESPASTVDIAPTILDLAGARPLWSDGQSLLPYLANPESSLGRPRLIELVSPGELSGESGWRTPLLVKPLDPKRPAGRPPGYRYRALQVGSYKYLSYDRGGEELYDLANDPFELNSLHSNLIYLELLGYMRRSLADLRSCRGLGCHVLPEFSSGPLSVSKEIGDEKD